MLHTYLPMVFSVPPAVFLYVTSAVLDFMLTKHCCRCGRNLGINYFFVDEEGNWSTFCRFCQPQKQTNK